MSILAMAASQWTTLVRTPLAWSMAVSTRSVHTSSALCKERAGRYRATVKKTRPLTYEMAFRPDQIGIKKDFNSFNTAQLEGTFLHKEEIGQDLPHKMLLEDMFVRKFLHGTWPEVFVSEIIIKRQHNLVRISGVINKSLPSKKVYFLIGYTEELLSAWLKCPVKLELQAVNSKDDVAFRYI